MKVLGIVHEHNATVCLMQDGEVVFCQSEERLNRIKNSSGFPTETLRHVYERVASPETIDLAVIYEKTVDGYILMKKQGFVPFSPGQYINPASVAPGVKRRILMTGWGWKLRALKRTRERREIRIRNEAESYFAQALQMPREKVVYMDHHHSHACGVLPNISSWGETLVFTLDGYGDGLCATVNLVANGQLTRLSACDGIHSLGFYYIDTAWLLGMKSLEDEYKIMGLAPYARPEKYAAILDGLRRLLAVDENGEWRSTPNPVRRLADLQRLYSHQRFDNVAGAIQALTEELIVKWIRYWVKKTGCRNVAVTGGVFMNVKANKRVAEIEEVDRLFVMPSAGDESCAIGAAVWGTRLLAPQLALRPLGPLYLGSDFSTVEVEQSLAQSGASSRYVISRPADMGRAVCLLLAENRIVGRCCGRMEFGARALGNRSILAHPGDPENVRRINEAIKGRDFWMPFGPSILEEDMSRYVVNPERIFAPYMSIAFDSTPEAERHLIAAIHPRDRTLRPQCVRREWNPEYHAIILEFKRITGIGGVLNTSFNLHGEPLVCSPSDAIKAMDESGLEHLILGEFLLTKRSASNTVVHRDADIDTSVRSARQ